MPATLKSILASAVAVCTLVAPKVFASEPLPAATATDAMEIQHHGHACTDGLIRDPYSTVHINRRSGQVTFVEHIACDGTRTTSVSADEKTYSYKAYESFLDDDNKPLTMTVLREGGFEVQLKTAARIRVSDPQTGKVLASYPSGGAAESKVYDVPADILRGCVGRLVVVDVIRSSDMSFRGTKTIEYNP